MGNQIQKQSSQRIKKQSSSSNTSQSPTGISQTFSFRTDVPPSPSHSDDAELTSEKMELLRTINRSIIGKDEVISTPFGLRRLVYCDYTASGRCLTFIEDWIRENVMPLYANTQ